MELLCECEVRERLLVVEEATCELPEEWELVPSLISISNTIGQARGPQI